MTAINLAVPIANQENEKVAMIDMLMKDVENILEKGGFDYCFYSGCFDIAARRDFTFFLKILENVDSFQQSQAINLKIISRDFNAAIALIGLHTRRERLFNNIVYERFDVPTFTPPTLENIVINNMFPFIYRSRGGLFLDIDPGKLRAKRKKAGLSQSGLARMVGVSKKNIYEHEKERKKAKKDVVERVEKILGEVSDSAVLEFEYSNLQNQPKNRFERKVNKDLVNIGFSTDLVYHTPFNILAKGQKMVIISKADENNRRIEKDIPHVLALSELMDIPALAITKEDVDFDLPAITEDELRDMQVRDLKRLLR